MGKSTLALNKYNSVVEIGRNVSFKYNHKLEKNQATGLNLIDYFPNYICLYVATHGSICYFLGEDKWIFLAGNSAFISTHLFSMEEIDPTPHPRVVKKSIIFFSFNDVSSLLYRVSKKHIWKKNHCFFQ